MSELQFTSTGFKLNDKIILKKIVRAKLGNVQCLEKAEGVYDLKPNT